MYVETERRGAEISKQVMDDPGSKGIPRPVHLPHTAGAEWREDLEGDEVVSR